MYDNTHMTRQLLTTLTAALFFAGCGVSNADFTEVDDDTVQEGSELSTVYWSHVTIRHDDRRCASPMCGGWWVKDVNRPNSREQYVSALNFAPSKLDDASIELAQGPDVVLQGRLELSRGSSYYKFRVFNAWRGLPGKAPGARDTFYRVNTANIQCVRAPCPSLSSYKLNNGATSYFMGTDLSRASTGQLDQDWVISRINTKGALVAGTFTQVNRVGVGTETILDAAQVYLKLPELPGPCPQFKLAACQPGYVHSYTRNEDRCIVPTGCVIAPRCAQIRPGCATDYTAVTWNGPCPQWSCDPTFTLPPAE